MRAINEMKKLFFVLELWEKCVREREREGEREKRMHEGEPRKKEE